MLIYLVSVQVCKLVGVSEVSYTLVRDRNRIPVFYRNLVQFSLIDQPKFSIFFA